MNTTNTIAKLIHIPRNFRTRGDVSILSLLKETGYFDAYDSISEEDIRAVLHGHAECIEDWLTYSQDKRSDEGWYFQQEDGDGYIVGYSPGRDDQLRQYSVATDACAFFIKHELEDIRQRSCPGERKRG